MTNFLSHHELKIDIFSHVLPHWQMQPHFQSSQPSELTDQTLCQGHQFP